MSDYIKQNGIEGCRFDSSESWVILSEIEQRIKDKIEAVGTPLKDWDINIYRGILTGCNEAFIIDKTKRNEILANCKTEEERQKTAEIIRPNNLLPNAVKRTIHSVFLSLLYFYLRVLFYIAKDDCKLQDIDFQKHFQLLKKHP